MDRTLKKICGLLASPDPMRRYAAAVTLAELAPKDPGVVQALGETLQDANPTLASYVLEAFEAIGSKAAVPYVMALLDAEEMETRLRAVSIISRAGAGVVPEIRARLPEAGRSRKLVLVDLLARIHSREAFRLILNLLFEPDFEFVKDVCEAVRRHLAGAAPRSRTAMHQQLVTFMKTDRVKSQERVLTSCLLLLGYVGRSEARTILLQHAGPKAAPYVRRYALMGLKNLEIKGAAAAAVSRKVLTYLNESDETVVRQAVELLDRLPSFTLSPAGWKKLLDSRSATVRGFAARKLAAADTAVNNRRLLGLLDHADHNVQEIAAGALAAHKKATPLLLDALARESGPEKAWRLVKILKPHAGDADKKTLKRFTDLARRDLQTGNARHEALLYFLRHADPKAADAVLLDSGMTHKRAKRWAEAVGCLRRLIHTESFDDETRYNLSVCDLKLSAKDPTPHMRAEDYALRGFQGLLRSTGFDLLDRLKKDRTLTAADLYYVGFHFSESVGQDREFGEKILAHVAAKWPKSKDGRAAKNKIKITKPGPAPRAPSRKRKKTSRAS